MKTKFKEGEIYKMTKKSLEWYADYAEEGFSVSGIVKVETHEDLLHYGLERFSFQNNKDIYMLVEGSNEYSEDCFAYKCYIFNELGHGWGYFEPSSMEKL